MECEMMHRSWRDHKGIFKLGTKRDPKGVQKESMKYWLTNFTFSHEKLKFSCKKLQQGSNPGPLWEVSASTNTLLHLR